MYKKIADVLMENIDVPSCFGFFRGTQSIAYVVVGEEDFIKNEVFRLMQLFPNLCIVRSFACLVEDSDTKFIVQGEMELMI